MKEIAGPFSRQNQSYKWILILFFIYLFLSKLYPLISLPKISDEYSDWWFSHHFFELFNFLDQSFDADNARLPHLVSFPFAHIFNQENIVSMRLLFLGFHFLYLIALYKTMRLRFSKLTSSYTVIAVGSCNFLASFSIFTATTSNNLFLLTTTLVIFYYLKEIEKTNSYDLKKISLFAFLIALMISSRITGVFNLIAVFLYDILLKRNFSFKLPKLKLLAPDLVFISTVLLFNFYLHTAVGLIFLVIILAIYLSLYIYRYKTKEYNIGVSTFWIMTIILAFNLTLIFSPSYLNFNNLLRLFNWLEKSHDPSILISPSFWDPFEFMLIKGIWPVLLPFLLAIFLSFKEMRRTSLYLFLMLLVVNIISLLISDFFSPLYMVPIFPFFFIIYSTLIERLQHMKKGLLLYTSLLFLIFIPIREQYYFWKFAPYSHLQGIEKGKEYFGWTKPGFLTFEYFDDVYHFFKNEKNTVRIQYNGWPSKRFNEWARFNLNEYLRLRGLEHIRFYSQKFTKDFRPEFYFTTLYTKDKDLKIVEKKFTPIKEFKIRDYVVATLWKSNSLSFKK